MITYSIALQGASITVSSLAVDSSDNILVGTETSSALYGAHTVRLTGTADDSRYDSTSTSTYVDFLLNLIKLEGTLSD